jgi:hypothetical protein
LRKKVIHRKEQVVDVLSHLWRPAVAGRETPSKPGFEEREFIDLLGSGQPFPPHTPFKIAVSPTV